MSLPAPVPFALCMASISASAPYVALVFDDGAAVSLHSVRPLAAELGLRLPQGTLFDLIADWDRTFPALAVLVQALAHSDPAHSDLAHSDLARTDLARGHRAGFIAEDFLTMETLLPETRQVFRLTPDGARLVPPTAIVGASASVTLDAAMKRARPNIALGAVIGRLCRHTPAETAMRAVAGWVLASELVHPGATGLRRGAAPGSLVLGPFFVPAAFAPPLLAGEYLLALTGAPAARGVLADLAQGLPEALAALSQECLLLPGDLVIAGPDPATEGPLADQIDTIEAVARGFGRQTVSLF